jgi:vitamin B12 transporter
MILVKYLKLFVMNRLFFGIALNILFSPLYGSGEGIRDTVIQIREVNVYAKRLGFDKGRKVQIIDSALLSKFYSNNLGQLLTQTSSLNILSYGPGLSTVSTRGSGSNHTSVLWNNMNLQDVFNGGVDLSQIPVNFIDDVKIQFGGNSSLYGSGSIGGTIHLMNEPEFHKGTRTRVISEYGSFDNKYAGGDFTSSNRNHYYTIRLFGRDAANDYPFYKSKTSIETIYNARRTQYGLLAGNAIHIGNKSLLETNYWYQHNDQLIMLSTNKQKSDEHRISNQWKMPLTKGELSIRAGQNFQNLLYNNTTRYKYIQLINEIELNRNLTRWALLNTGVTYLFEKGSSQSHVRNPHRNRYAALGAIKFSLPAYINASVNLRSEVIDHKISPVTYSFGTDFTPFHFLTLKGNASRNFRVPTFNDLYWEFSGNPDLLNEKGFCTEAGAVFFSKYTSYEITAFSNRVTNWIQWQPEPNWVPVNIGIVWARGLENVWKVNKDIGHLKTFMSSSYSYTLSTKENKDGDVDPSFHKQLINVPRHKALINVKLDYKNYGIFYSHNYSGLRYSTVDNSMSAIVHSYHVDNLGLACRFNYRRIAYTLNFTVNNLWDKSYEVLKGYPMPLRNYLFNIQFNLNK